VRYQFKCNDCNTIFEITSSPTTIVGLKVFCPECSSDDVIRKYFSTAVIYKADGFYSSKEKHDE